MRHLPALPWSRINDYLLELSSASTITGFFASACSEIQRLIPYDHGCILTLENGSGVYQSGYDQRQLRVFNEYYHSRVPYFRNGVLARDSVVASWNQIDWNVFRSSEFVTDFARPMRLGRTLTSIAPKRTLFLNANRSGSAVPFSEREKAILDLVSGHIDNLFACFSRLDELSARAMPNRLEIAERFPALSQREAEILSLWIRGLSSPMIASRLFIGARTVESHVAHIYDKLGVRSKGEVLRRLKVS